MPHAGPMETMPCARPFGDCRSSLCCRSSPSDGGREQFACMRRPLLYYAQCNPIAHTECLSSSSETGADAEWLCPGWEPWGAPNDECTSSRCCSTPNFGCFLNSSAGAWHAYCEPLTLGTGRSSDRVQLHQVAPGEEIINFDAAHSNMTDEEFFYLQVSTKHAFCEGTPQWRCIEAWREQSHHANVVARKFMHEHGLEPAAIAGIAVGGVLLACCALACAFAYRRRMQAQLLQLESELAEFRHAKHEAKEKKKGGEHVAALVTADGHAETAEEMADDEGRYGN